MWRAWLVDHEIFSRWFALYTVVFSGLAATAASTLLVPPG